MLPTYSANGAARFVLPPSERHTSINFQEIRKMAIIPAHGFGFHFHDYTDFNSGHDNPKINKDKSDVQKTDNRDVKNKDNNNVQNTDGSGGA